MAQATNLNPAGLSGPRRCRAARPAAAGESSRLVPHCGRPAGQISPIASALATSSPAVRGSLTGTPVPQPDSWASRHPSHDDGDSPVTVTPTPPPPALPTAACGPRAAGLGYQSPSKIEGAAISACICLYHCHICMYTVCMCLYLHVCVCILNDLEKNREV